MYLISLLGAQEVFGHMLWQHVGDQSFVPPSHLEHHLLLVMHTDLPKEQLPGLKLQLHTHIEMWFMLCKVSRGSFPLEVLTFRAVVNRMWVSKVYVQKRKRLTWRAKT